MTSVKDYWDNQAKTLGTQGTATAPDQHYRNLEIEQIIAHLNSAGNMIDIGCGNGFSTLKFKEARPKTTFTGVDFSPEMIAAARRANDKTGNTVTFAVGDVRALRYEDDLFDTTITERCLINLAGWEEQKAAILELRRITKKNGAIIVVENTIEGLAALNSVRKKFGLPAIQQRWHNRYIPQVDFIKFVNENGMYIQVEKNIGSMYYLISRVIHAKIAAVAGREPEYDHPLNEWAAMLPIVPNYHYSPNVLWVLRKS